MKICFYTTGDIKSLATMKRALGMATPLQALGWKVFIISKDTEENRKRINMEASCAKVYYFRTESALQEIVIKWRLLHKINPDVVWVCSLGVRNLVAYNKGQILVEHSELGSAIPDNKGFRKILIKLFERMSIHYHGLICASKYLQSHFSQIVQKSSNKLPILYSPYAYNTEVANLPNKIIDQLRQAYPSGKKFVYMGTLTKNYGLFTMLEAAKLLKENGYRFQLFLLGRGRHKNEAELYIVENNLIQIVIMTDYVEEEDLSSYFSLADAFISPLNDTVQDWARCPSKIYMYLPYQKPILTCAIGEPKEIFGDIGFYFNNDDPNSLVELMVSICKESHNKPIMNSNEHSWDMRANQFDKWYKDTFKQ